VTLLCYRIIIFILITVLKFALQVLYTNSAFLLLFYQNNKNLYLLAPQEDIAGMTPTIAPFWYTFSFSCR